MSPKVKCTGMKSRAKGIIVVSNIGRSQSVSIVLSLGHRGGFVSLGIRLIFNKEWYSPAVAAKLSRCSVKAIIPVPCLGVEAVELFLEGVAPFFFLAAVPLAVVAVLGFFLVVVPVPAPIVTVDFGCYLDFFLANFCVDWHFHVLVGTCLDAGMRILK